MADLYGQDAYGSGLYEGVDVGYGSGAYGAGPYGDVVSIGGGGGNPFRRYNPQVKPKAVAYSTDDEAAIALVLSLL